MINVLINAYAVSPTWGSEPGVGWNWIVNIAKECNVFVITESEWESEIKQSIDKLPQKNNLHFYFNPVSQDVRNMCWRQGDWRFYKHYKNWQKETFRIAKQIIAENRIDIIHQLNMIGFREPGYLWQIKEIPFVWGPIGNMSPVPLRFINGSSTIDKFKLFLKNHISAFQARTGRVKKALKRADKLIIALNDTAELIQNLYGRNDIIIMPETGLNVSSGQIHTYDNSNPLKLLWVGRFIPTKKLDLALTILSRLKNKKNFELHIVGWGSEYEEKYYRDMATSLEIKDHCKWYGKLPNEKVQNLMKTCDLFLFTSVVEGTPHVILEAIANNLPIICFDLCGQGVIVNDAVGWKFKTHNFSDAILKMTNTLDQLEQSRDLITQKSKNCEARKPELSWENKIKKVITIYNSLIINPSNA